MAQLSGHQVAAFAMARRQPPVTSVSRDDVQTSHSKLAGAMSNRRKRRKVDPVQTVNDLTQHAFYHKYIQEADLLFERPDAASAKYSVTYKHRGSTSQAEKKQCLDLIEATSSEDYRASTRGWRPTDKEQEMADPDMHYLLVHGTHDSHKTPDTPIAGFLSFMITYDSSPKVPVLYVYEIHLVENTRKCGLGRHLLDIASGIAQRTDMDKIMLTCFVSNDRARRFYCQYGFEEDAVSPAARQTRSQTIEADYVILSKLVNKE